MYPNYPGENMPIFQRLMPGESFSGQLLFLGVRPGAPKLLSRLKRKRAEGRDVPGHWARMWASIRWKLDVLLAFSLMNHLSSYLTSLFEFSVAHT